MLTAICDRCGTRHDLDPGRIPPSGLVMKCTGCAHPMTVSPPDDGTDLPAPVSRAPAAPAARLPGREISLGPAFNDGGEDVVDLPAPKGTAPRRGVVADETPDLVAPVRASGRAPLEVVAPAGRPAVPQADDLLAPVGPAPRRGGNTPPKKPVEPVELPAPKPAIDDLLAPVGPAPSRQIPDLLTPVAPRRPDKLAPVAQPPLPDLPAPVGPVPSKGPADQLRPVGPAPVKNLPDLLTPVGPAPVKNAPDLLTPVGPAPVKNLPDLLTPVGPAPVKNAPDLLTPVGPAPVKNAPDLLTPVGPAPVKNAPGLLTPVGPVPTRGPGDLLTPVTGRSDLMSPVGPVPTHGPDLLAPQGYFDDAPPPSTGVRLVTPLPMEPPAELELDDDELDVLPAGEPSHSAPSPLELFEAEPPSAMPLDGLDLLPPAGTEGPDYGEVDLGPPQEGVAGVVSFSRPDREAARSDAPPVDLTPLETRPAAPVRKPVAPKPVAEPRSRRGRNIALGIFLALAALGGGAFYVYENVDFSLAGFHTAPAEERLDRVASGLASMKKQLASDERGHWDQVVAAGKRLRSLDAENAEAMALMAQAYLAAAIDEGRELKPRLDAASDLIGQLTTRGVTGPELDKATALRDSLDPGKAVAAHKALAQLARSQPRDADLALYQGWAALAARDWKAALAAFGRAAKMTPERLPVLYGLGRAQLALGERDAAGATFEKVIARKPEQKHIGAWLGLIELKTEPGDRSGRRESELAALCERAPERATADPRDLARAWTLYGDEALATNRFDLAGERYREARKLDPANRAALVGNALATVELRAQGSGKADLAEARRELDEALKLAPDDVRALVGITRIQLLEGKPLEARQTIEKAAKLDDKNAVVQLWLGRVLADPAIAEMPAAEAALRKSIELAPEGFAAYVVLAKLLGARGDAKGAVAVLAPIADAARKDAPLANALGLAYLGAREYGSAEAAFRTALGVDPGHVEAKLNLGDALAAQGRVGDAVTQYQAILEKEPQREDAALRLAAAFERMRRFDDAEKVIAKLLSTDGGNLPSPRVRAAAGRYFARRGQPARAGAEAEQLFAADPRNPTAFYLRGVAQFAEGRHVDAVKDVTEAVQLEPQAEYWETLGRMHEKLLDLGAAQAAFNQALRMDPTLGAAVAGLGRLHLARREWSAALVYLEKAAPLAPYDAGIWLGIGWARHEMRELDAAVKAYEQALARDPRGAEIHFRLGRTHFDRDDGPRTISHLKSAIAMAPAGAEWLPEAYRLLGTRYKANGQSAEACAAFTRYLAIAPQNDILRDEVRRNALSCP